MITDEYALRKIIASKPKWRYDFNSGLYHSRINDTLLFLIGSKTTKICLVLRKRQEDEKWKKYDIIEPNYLSAFGLEVLKTFGKEVKCPPVKELLDELLNEAMKQCPVTEKEMIKQSNAIREELLRDVTGWNEF
jgi:hypothetical protein